MTRPRVAPTVHRCVWCDLEFTHTGESELERLACPRCGDHAPLTFLGAERVTIESRYAQPAITFPFVHVVDQGRGSDRTICGKRFAAHWRPCYPADGPMCTRCEAINPVEAEDTA